MSKKRIFDEFLFRSLAGLMEPGNKSQFRYYDDTNGNWYDFLMNGKEVTIQGDSLEIEDADTNWTLKGDLFKLITGCQFNEPTSQDTKNKINFSEWISILDHML